MQSTRSLIERFLAQKLSETVQLRVIEGTTEADWELVRRRDEEARRLQEAALQKSRAEVQARSTWDSTYEHLSRLNASIPTKSLPQNRAKFFTQAMDLLIEALKVHSVDDDLSERNFARCIERVAQYSEMPSVMVAYEIQKRQGQ